MLTDLFFTVDYLYEKTEKILYNWGMKMRRNIDKSNSGIKTVQELSFVIFCIENLAIKLNIDASVIYKALIEGNDFIHNYIVAGYEFLHTQDKEYILNDILDEMKRQEISI